MRANVTAQVFSIAHTDVLHVQIYVPQSDYSNLYPTLRRDVHEIAHMHHARERPPRTVAERERAGRAVHGQRHLLRPRPTTRHQRIGPAGGIGAGNAIHSRHETADRRRVGGAGHALLKQAAAIRIRGRQDAGLAVAGR